MVPSSEAQGDSDLIERRGEGKSWSWEPGPQGNLDLKGATFQQQPRVTVLRGHGPSYFMHLPWGGCRAQCVRGLSGVPLGISLPFSVLEAGNNNSVCSWGPLQSFPTCLLILVLFSSQVREKEPLSGAEQCWAIYQLRRGGWLRLP